MPVASGISYVLNSPSSTKSPVLAQSFAFPKGQEAEELRHHLDWKSSLLHNHFKLIYFLIILEIYKIQASQSMRSPTNPFSCCTNMNTSPFFSISPLNLLVAAEMCFWWGESYDISHPVVKKWDYFHCQEDHLRIYEYSVFCFSHPKHWPIDLVRINNDKYQISCFLLKKLQFKLCNIQNISI